MNSRHHELEKKHLRHKLQKQLDAVLVLEDIGAAKITFKSGGVMSISDIIDTYERKIRDLKKRECSCGCHGC